MAPFTCEMCNFSSSLSANFKRHLNTKKHKKNEEKLRNETEKKNKIPSDLLQNPPKSEEIPPKPSEIPPKFLQNSSKHENDFWRETRKAHKFFYRTNF